VLNLGLELSITKSIIDDLIISGLIINDLTISEFE
jgi:hypothetical protein